MNDHLNLNQAEQRLLDNCYSCLMVNPQYLALKLYIESEVTEAVMNGLLSKVKGKSFKFKEGYANALLLGALEQFIKDYDVSFAPPRIEPKLTLIGDGDLDG